MDKNTVRRDVSGAQELIQQAKGVVSPARFSSKGLGADACQELWSILDRAEGQLDGLLTLIAIRDSHVPDTTP